MPPNKKRQAKRFFFDSEKYPKFPKIVHQLRGLIVEQRREYKDSCSKELLFRRSLRAQLNERRRNFVIPQSAEERQIRLAGVDGQLGAKQEIRKTLMCALGRIDRLSREAQLEKVCKLAAEDHIEEGRLHNEHAMNQSLEISELHERMSTLIRNPSSRNSEVACSDAKLETNNAMANETASKELNSDAPLEGNIFKIPSSSVPSDTMFLSSDTNESASASRSTFHSMNTPTARNASNRSIFDLLGSMNDSQSSSYTLSVSRNKSAPKSGEFPFHSISMPPPDPLPSTFPGDKRLRILQNHRDSNY